MHAERVQRQHHADPTDAPGRDQDRQRPQQDRTRARPRRRGTCPPTAAAGGRASGAAPRRAGSRPQRVASAPTSAPRAQAGNGRNDAGGRADEAEGDRLHQVRGEKAPARARQPRPPLRSPPPGGRRPSTLRPGGRAGPCRGTSRSRSPRRSRGTRPRPERLAPGERAQRLDDRADANAIARSAQFGLVAALMRAAGRVPRNHDEAQRRSPPRSPTGKHVSAQRAPRGITSCPSAPRLSKLTPNRGD